MKRIKSLQLHNDSVLQFHELATNEEDEAVIVGMRETGNFVSIPGIGIEAIKLMQRGSSISETSKLLERKYNVLFDIVVFTNALLELGFVKSIDGHQVPSIKGSREQKNALPWLMPHHVQWLFSSPAKILYLSLLFSAVFAALNNPKLVLSYKLFFWTPSESVVVAVNTAFFVVNLCFHELAHLIAARSLGASAYFSLGTRLHELVAQTTVSNLWTIPRKKRYRVYLAGLLWDTISASIIILAVTYGKPSAALTSVLLCFLFLIVLSIVWQFNFYKRTDIYFVVLDALHCYNLFEDAILYIHYQYQRMTSRLFGLGKKQQTNPLDAVRVEDRWKIKSYSVLLFVGSAISLTSFTVYGIPIALTLFGGAISSLYTGFTAQKPLVFIDGLVVLLIEGAFQFAFIHTLILNKKGRMRHYLHKAKLRLAA